MIENDIIEFVRGLDAGSEVIMEFEKTFWSEKYGILRDPYGVPWMIQVYEEMEAQ